MIVNLYADSLATHPPQSAEDVWNEAREHPIAYGEAADRIGLTAAEYREFQKRLLDGDAVYALLPRRVDAMAGRHGFRVYAVRNAVMTTRVYGWRVALADGRTVWVPSTCGNLSVVGAPVVAIARRHYHAARPAVHKYSFVPALKIASMTPVNVAPSAASGSPTSNDVQKQEAAYVPPAVVAAAATGPNGLFAIPIVGAIAGAIFGITHDSPPAPPPCSSGSNVQFACRR